ncbi:response regulator [Bradyrhizobium elkanii]|uniref:response regulator n=1 Tax=Bradyrhizobium elkanii TaxID=29448 RepID=UPI00068636F6|nr:response regulator [Bradyrhizobium elkanii]
MLVSASLASGWIAVVDDDVSLREAISSLLRAHSLHARTFGSAEAFLPALVTGMPSCVIFFFDMHMPGRTGLELLQHLRANGFQIPQSSLRQALIRDYANIARRRAPALF